MNSFTAVSIGINEELQLRWHNIKHFLFFSFLGFEHLHSCLLNSGSLFLMVSLPPTIAGTHFCVVRLSFSPWITSAVCIYVNIYFFYHIWICVCSILATSAMTKRLTWTKIVANNKREYQRGVEHKELPPPPPTYHLFSGPFVFPLLCDFKRVFLHSAAPDNPWKPTHGHTCTFRLLVCLTLSCYYFWHLIS